MSVLGEMLGGAVPHEFVHGDKTYEVKLIDQEVKLAFERRLFARAKEAAREMRDLMDREQYQAHLKQLNDDYIAGEYGLESERGMSAMRSVPGMVLLLSLLFSVDEATMMRLLSARQDDLVPLVQLLLHESYPQKKEGPDPNPGAGD